jgi:hypothetical protein
MTFTDLKATFARSQTLITLPVLWGLGCIYIIFVLVTIPEATNPILQLDPSVFRILLFTQLLTYILGMIGCMTRQTWGRIAATAACIFMILGLSILGIALGILGIMTCVKSQPLFGPNRLLHKDLKEEFLYRKKNKIG